MCHKHLNRNSSWKYSENVLTLRPSKMKREMFHLSNGCTAVNGCHLNESPNSWYKHNNNPQVIHITPVHQLVSGEGKRCTFLRNKSIIITFLRHCFGVHNPIMVLSPVKKSESGETSAQIKHCLQTKSVQNRSKQICGWMFTREDNKGWSFSLEEALTSYFSQS